MLGLNCSCAAYSRNASWSSAAGISRSATSHSNFLLMAYPASTPGTELPMRLMRHHRVSSSA